MKRVIKYNVLIPSWLQFQKTPLWHFSTKVLERFLPKRSTRTYVIGPPKTGTHYIASIFNSEVARHEPETHTLFFLRRQLDDQKISLDTAFKVLEARDRYLSLHLESSWILHLVLDLIIELFPDSKFIITVRDPISWINSKINQEFIIGDTEPYRSIYNYTLDRPKKDEEASLKEKGLYSIDSYFKYWSYYYSHALDIIPEDNVLLIKTYDLSRRDDNIISFTSINPEFVSEQRITYSRDTKPLNIFKLVDSDYLLERCKLNTKKTIKRIRSRGVSLDFHS